MANEALPDRYEVSRRGTPDPPTARYYVLDYANDFPARIVLRTLVRAYRVAGRPGAAAELEAALEDSRQAFSDLMHRQNEERAAAARKANAGRGSKGSSSTNRKSMPMS